MSEKKGNGLDRYQQAVHMYGHQNVLEHDILKRSHELQAASCGITDHINNYYITKDVDTDLLEAELTDALALITQLSTCFGIKLSDLAKRKVIELKGNK